MRQEYKLDLAKQSSWAVAPPYDTGSNTNMPPFVVSEAGKFYAKKNYFTIREGKNNYLLIFTVSGKGKLQYSGNCYELTEGSAFAINCEEYHEYSTDENSEDNWVFYWMHFSGDGCPFYLSALYPKQFDLVYIENTMGMASYFEAIFASLKHTDIHYFCLQSSAVEQILSSMVSIGATGTVSKKQDLEHTEKMSTVMSFIDKNYWQPLSLDGLAKSIGLSKFHFIRIFKNHNGITPYRYITIQRINEAKKLLRTTDLKISEISMMVGFRDECHFSRTFKDVTGITPLQYRNSQ